MLRTLRRLLVPMFAAGLLAGPASAQSAGGADLAERTFQNAEQLMREGKEDQALKDYQQVVQAFPDSPYADDALLALGSFHYPAERLWDLGASPADAQEKARSFFDQIRERYPESDSAPHALYKLGLLALEPLSPRRNLDEAYASFYGVVNIYPASAWVAPALRGAAFAELGKRDYDRAIVALERALEAAPRSLADADTHYFLGLANVRAGDWRAAAEAFESSRLEAPGDPVAEKALRWLTIVYNMRIRPQSGGKPTLAHDASFVPRLPTGEDLRGDLSLAVSGDGTLAAADSKRGEVLFFSENGEIARRETVPAASFVGFDAIDKPVYVGSDGIRFGKQKFPAARKSGSETKSLEEIGAVWRDDRGVFVLDLEEGELLRYKDDPDSPATLHSDKEAKTRIVAMRAGPAGRLVFLDDKGKRVMELESGKLVPLGAAVFQDPVDLAVNPLGDVYVLDARAGAVVILDPAGAETARIAPAKGSLGELSGPAALAVGSRGEVYVYDERKRTILRFD